MKGRRQIGKKPHDEPVPEVGRLAAQDWLKGKRVGAVLAYVDDLLSAAARNILDAMFKALSSRWELSSPEFGNRTG